MVTILYHSNCPDGFCSAWIASKKFEGNFKPVNFYEGPPWEIIDGQDVYILDFSYSRVLMEEIHKRANSLRCLDHHKTAEEALRGLDYCTFDMKKCGAVLTWEYFFPKQDIPSLVLYVQDRDLWKWELPRSREISACIGSYDFTFEDWDMLDNSLIGDLIQQGTAILRYKEQLVKRIVDNAFEMEVNGHKVLVANTCVLQSEVGEALAKGKPFSATFFHKTAIDRNWSLRSTSEGVDVAEIAKSRSGGGHKQAAGFREIIAKV